MKWTITTKNLWKKIIFLSLVLLFFGTSCNPLSKSSRARYHLQKARKIQPELFMTDTLTYIDTILIKEYSKDTISQLIYGDTVTVINDNKTILKYYIDSSSHKISHYYLQKKDTVLVEKKIAVEKVIEKTLKEQIIDAWAWILACLAALLLVIYLLKR